MYIYIHHTRKCSKLILMERMAATQRIQHSPYDVQVREAVVHMYFTLGYTMHDIAYHFGGHPNRDTVGRIVQDFLRCGGEVVAPTGRTGVLHSTRKFNALAWGTLCRLLEIDSQSTLRGGETGSKSIA